jgi:hypothetical protein
VMITLLAVFHRPLILSLVQWAGPKGAATQGLPALLASEWITLE